MSDQKEKLRDWWIDFIGNRRDEDRAPFHTIQDYSSPCQVEIFWMNEPLEGQLIITTGDKDRPDMEIIVNGPYSGENFIEEVGNVSEEDRWQKEVPPQDFKTPPGKTPTREDVLANLISQLTDRLEQSIYSDLPSPDLRLKYSRLWPQASYRITLGNSANIVIDSPKDPEDDEDNSADSENGDQSSDEDTDTEDQKEVQEQPAGGGYIYPATWVEDVPEKSFTEKVWQSNEFHFDTVLETDICGHDFQARRDGLLFLKTEDDKETQQILNTLFGIGILHRNRQWRTLLKQEIVPARFEDGDFSTSSYEISTPSGRNQLANPHDRPSDNERSMINTQTIERYIEIVDAVYPIHNVRNRIILHLQAHTHLLDDELDASFVLNWTVVEQLIDDLLKRNIRQDYNIEWEDKALEYAAAVEIINHSEYELLDEFREKRNDIIHHMGSASVEEAEKLDILLSKILVRDINHHLSNKNIDEINYRSYPIKYSNRADKDLARELSNI